MDIKRDIKNLLESKEIKNYRISKETGIAQTTLSDYATGKSKIGNMKLDHALKLYDFYKKEMAKMDRIWEFENYTVIEETDVLRFENKEGDVIGHVMKNGNEV